MRERALWMVVLLAGLATAAAGPISFVGLIVPHAVRAMVGPSHARVLPLSLGWDAMLVVVADTVGRVIAPPTEVLVGIMTQRAPWNIAPETPRARPTRTASTARGGLVSMRMKLAPGVCSRRRPRLLPARPPWSGERS